MSQSSSAFRLSIWKPANPTRQLMACSGERSHFDWELHEQVYSWEPAEDIWGSVVDAEQTRRLRSALVETFDPNQPAKERGIFRLQDALTVLAEVLNIPNATAWSECNEVISTSGGDPVNLRANTILLLYRHLDWVWTVFKHLPGASVTIR